MTTEELGGPPVASAVTAGAPLSVPVAVAPQRQGNAVMGLVSAIALSLPLWAVIVVTALILLG